MKLLSIKGLMLATMSVLALSAISFGQTTFPGAGGGAIADGAGVTTCGSYGAATNVTFNVSGMSGAPTAVKLNMNITHTWRGDLDVVLTAPNGTAFTIMKQTGGTTATACGSGNDLAGTYGFVDTAAGNWWTIAGTPTPVGDYRTSAALTGAQTAMNAAFAGIPTANGTWTLSVKDGGVGDTGTVNAATSSLVLTGGTAVTADAPVDMNGDGKTDYVVARNEGGQLIWYTLLNGGAVSGAAWGTSATDFLVNGDFDGDNKDDIAVWRPGTQGVFYVLQSATGTAKIVNFGQTDDDPTVVGDYDGDGKADPAVYRCPALGSGDGQCFYYYLGSNNNPGGNITFGPWGFGENGDFFANPGDFDGDGKYDFCIQRADPTSATSGQFVLKRSSDNGVEYINWGNSSDFIVPGDYDGDGKNDFCVRRTISGVRHHFILERDGGGTGAVGIQWGATGDISCPGDYDGDGKTDVCAWRAGNFYVLNSSNSAMNAIGWGATNDIPVASYSVH